MTNYNQILYIKKGDVVLDIGAAEGSFSLPIVDKVKSLILVEPNPTYIDILKKKFNILDKVSYNKKVLLINKVVYNKKIKKQFIPSNISCKENVLSRGITIETDTIDNIFNQLHRYNIYNIDFIKMNIAGSEIEALQRANYALKYTNKIVVSAYHKRPDLSMKNTYKWVNNYLKGKGFNTIITMDNKLVHAWRRI